MRFVPPDRVNAPSVPAHRTLTLRQRGLSLHCGGVHSFDDHSGSIDDRHEVVSAALMSIGACLLAAGGLTAVALVGTAIVLALDAVGILPT